MISWDRAAFPLLIAGKRMLPLTVYLYRGVKFAGVRGTRTCLALAKMRGKAPGVKLIWQDEGRV